MGYSAVQVHGLEQICTGAPGVEQGPGSELKDCTAVTEVDQWPSSEALGCTGVEQWPSNML